MNRLQLQPGKNRETSDSLEATMFSARTTLVLCLLVALACGCDGGYMTERSSSSEKRASGGGNGLIYPTARRNMSVVDDYHGTRVLDPYRWLENPNSAETKAFINAQNIVSKAYLDACPAKDQIRQKLTERLNYARYYCPWKKGSKYYYFHNTGLQNQNVLYMQDTPSSPPAVFLDPNTWSANGTVSLGVFAFSNDGSYIAYGISKGGSDWTTLKVKRAPSGEDLPDTLDYVKFTEIAWTHDNMGFFYSKFPTTAGSPDGSDTAVNINHTLYYHRLGTSQSQDLVAFSTPSQPKWLHFAEMSHDGHYLILSVTDSPSNNRLYIVDLQDLPHGITGPLNPIKVVDNIQNTYTYVTNTGRDFVFRTDKDASFYKLVRIDLSNPQPEHWVTLVAENSTRGLLETANCINNKLVLRYLTEAKSTLYIHSLQTGVEERQVRVDVGTIRCLQGRRTDTEMFYGFTSFLVPGIVYLVDMTTYQTTVFRESRVQGFERENYVTEQVFYSSKDGTRVPMFIVRPKDLQRTGDHPTLLYGYGGFGISVGAYFDSSVTLLIQHLGGVYALANIRGGSEYGSDWHRNGTLGNKQNVFDDFQAAGEYLINNNYTNSNKLAIEGGSNGGLLVAACLNQRPDLFAAGVTRVGVLDMLRFHLFTIGYAWVPEYGSSADPVQFSWLYKYSPLHNIPCTPEGGQYPATLLTTADKDDRVVPLHSLKFIATLQHKLGRSPSQTNPLIIRVDTDAGHGAGTPISKVIASTTEIFSFLYQALHMTWQS